MIRTKYFFPRNPWPLAITVIIAITIVTSFQTTKDWALVVTLTGTGLSLIYFIQKQKLEELHLFNTLFKDFNERYDCLNEDLTKIACDSGETPLDQGSKEILVKYFNLCGEEYLYYDLGYIYPQVWSAWKRGMRYYASNERVKSFWEKELGPGSYYGLSIDYILKE
jgi:hypothetical protein